jgi:hypothetical protein
VSLASTQSPPPEIPAVPVAARQVICDDLDALRRADPSFDPGAGDLLSFSPAVVLGEGAPCRALDRDIVSADITALFDWTIDIAAKCAGAIADSGRDAHGDAAYLAARTVLQLQPAFYLAWCLSRLGPAERDFIAVDYIDADFDRRFNGAGAVLAGMLPGITLRRIAEPDARSIESPAPPGATVGERLRFNPLSSHAYRIGLALWDRLGATPARGSVLIYRENELVKETAYHLMRCGYAVRSFSAPPRTLAPEPADSVLANRLGDIVRDAAAALFPPAYAVPVGRFAGDQAAAVLAELPARTASFDAAFGSAPNQRPRCVLTNFLGALDMTALHAACRRNDVPMVVFQHGVTAEICQPMARAWPALEAAAADLVCTYDQAFVPLGDSAPFSRARSVAVGMPSELRRSISRRARPPRRDIWYVSTSLPRGRAGMLHVAESDHRQGQFEIDLIDTVLSGLPHPVVYKPYPAIRYPDGDPVVARAVAAPGVRVHAGRGDFRFLAARCGVLVTARATSTLSWCLMSSRPVVFIDIPTQMPLLPAVRRLAEQALFLFDAGDPAMADDLRAFLSRPIADIETDWQARAAARNTLIDAYFDTDRGPAGHIAANAIEAHIEGTRT